MDFDASGQQATLRRIAWALGAAAGLGWFLGGLLLALAADRPAGTSAFWTAVSAFLVARLAIAVAHWRLKADFSPAEVEVSLGDPIAFRRRLQRRMGLLRFIRHENGFAGLTFLPGRLARRLLPPLRVRWEGLGARVLGPRCLVRMAVKLAV